jgi:hypothetical protein
MIARRSLRRFADDPTSFRAAVNAANSSSASLSVSPFGGESCPGATTGAARGGTTGVATDIAAATTDSPMIGSESGTAGAVARAIADSVQTFARRSPGSSF